MIIMTSTEAQKRFGELIDQAQQEPVEIRRSGRPVAYLISEHELQGLQDVRQRRKAAVQWYEGYLQSAVSRPEATTLTDDDINCFVHELR